MIERPDGTPPTPADLFEEAHLGRFRGRRRRAAGVLVLVAVGAGAGAWVSGAGVPGTVPRARSSTSTAVRTAPVPTCEASTLTPKVVTHGMGAGSRSLSVTLVNRAPRSCRLDGRPTVTVLGHGDVPLTTAEGTAEETVTGPARAVLVAPGGRVTFDVTMAGRGADGDPVLGSCPVLEGLEFTLPPSSGPRATEEAPMRPAGASAPIAAYPQGPGGSCDKIGVSVLFVMPIPPPSRPSTGGNAGAPAGQRVS